MLDHDQYEKGLKTRREVLGDAHVNRSLAATNELTKPLQDLVVEYGWGAIWARDGLDRAHRRAPYMGAQRDAARASEGHNGMVRCDRAMDNVGEADVVNTLQTLD